jgi:hypothetical protein
MSTKVTLPGTPDVQKYEPLLARYNPYAIIAAVLVVAFVLGVASDIYFGY